MAHNSQSRRHLKEATTVILPNILSAFFFFRCQKHELKKGHKQAPGTTNICPKLPEIDQRFLLLDTVLMCVSAMDPKKEKKEKSNPADSTGTSQSVKP